MNAQDRNRLNTVTAQANALLNSPPKLNPVVRNLDVLEALLADVEAIAQNRSPVELVKVTNTAREAGELGYQS